MITLEEYKKYLINTYVYEIDNSIAKKIERNTTLNNKYKDNYLNKIIIDTYKLINSILEVENNNYYRIKINENNLNYISLNLTGGWHVDTIYEDFNGNLISEYILKYFFGNTIIVEIKVDEYEFDTEDLDILSFDYEYYLYVQGFLPKNKILKKSL